MVEISNNEVATPSGNGIKKLSAKNMATFLEKYREEQGLSQAQMADLIGWKRQYYNYVLNKAHFITAETALKVCTSLNISFSELLKSDDSNLASFYPDEVLTWLSTERGRAAVMKMFARYKRKDLQRQIRDIQKQIQFMDKIAE